MQYNQYIKKNVVKNRTATLVYSRVVHSLQSFIRVSTLTL